MNGALTDNTFSPKQALAPTPELYNELASGGADKVAMASLACTAPIPAGSVVHDNGCGTGFSSAAILASLADGVKPGDIAIKATDMSDDALTAYRMAAEKRAADWPSTAWETQQMDASNLTFADETFTHSFMSLVIFVLSNNGVDAMKHVYRTLKPGGTAIVNYWSDLPNLPALRAAAEATRPSGTPRILDMMGDWFGPDKLRKTMEEAGFSPEKVSVQEVDIPIKLPDNSIDRFAFMLWSFLGGSTSAGWLRSDEERWDEAVGIVADKLRASKGYKKLEDGTEHLAFKAAITVATK
ncbi:S-adenosyl-L-methionine-dependent methyltransferase [Microdochium trichocladiopsis]|uniref:S-adenosyl-L-methionine-dependent methyltransferase n=1 Tax=Microdochium trichocladiopsis TaxID=1682393 RepID=A0A9P8Y3M5_9PEZI|nr:S-adenosyl-L-methionine-dependent methyltransferase [Microdochium trichocladiopsis]KAH7027899.1 S-adenosyl-L-methionine-dependent methyltransferase [Microdochium trichocladiopsis]